MRVFLTGATGLVGSHLAEALVRRGDQVSALVRATSDTTFVDGLGVRTVVGDMTDSVDRLTAAIGDCDAVAHGAALVYAGVPWSTIHAVNVVGTRRILTAAAAAGVTRAVHLSSVAVYGGRTERLDESAPIDSPIPPTDFYARSKRDSERAARQVMASTGLNLHILRPAAIYGPRDRLFAPKLARLARLPLIPLLGCGRTTLPVVYVGNVASAAVAALDHDGPATTCNVAEDHPIGMRELMKLFSRAQGKTPRFLSTPSRVVRGGARLIERIGVGIPGASDLPPSRAVALATSDNPYITERLRSELGWTPRISHAEGVTRTVAWMERDTR